MVFMVINRTNLRFQHNYLHIKSPRLMTIDIFTKLTYSFGLTQIDFDNEIGHSAINQLKKHLSHKASGIENIFFLLNELFEEFSCKLSVV